jgi:hypothetical protein
MTILDRLRRKGPVMVGQVGYLGDGKITLEQRVALVNPDGADAADFIEELGSALRLIQRDIRSDDLLSLDPELAATPTPSTAS